MKQGPKILRIVRAAGCTMFLFVGTLETVQAQTFEEWFKQKKTQKKYLVQQIAALQAYASYLKQGYDIASKGIATINSIKNGEFSLHQDFFGLLQSVNPEIRNSPKIASTISYQVSAIEVFNKLERVASFTVQEKAYIRNVKNNLLSECLQDMEELLLIVTNGKVEMNDQERIKRLDKIYKTMQDKYLFSSSFLDEASLFLAGRQAEEK